jgi:hypothetical protein
MVIIKCDTCGIEVDIKESELERSKHHFCSRKCYWQWRSKQQTGEKNRYWAGGKTKVICKVCEKEFELFPNYAKKRKYIFCSQNCYQNWRKIESKKNVIIIKCKICNEDIEIYKIGYDQNKLYCCSKPCESVLKSQLRVREGNPNWNGGTSFLPYCSKFTKYRRKAVRNFFGNACICCGKNTFENITTTGLQKELSVHHADHDKDQGCNGVPFNLVPLCMECHGKEQSRQQEYRDYINKTLNEGFKWGIWSKEQYEIEVMYS